MAHRQAISEVLPRARQFATYQEAVASLPGEAEWSCSFGDHAVGCDVFFRHGSKRWIVSNRDDQPFLSAWTVKFQ